MGYRVVTPEGEVEFATLEQLRDACAVGLVGADDRVLEPDGALWRPLAELRLQRPWWRRLAPEVAITSLCVAALLFHGYWGLLEVAGLVTIWGARQRRARMRRRR